jgi:hypothetical protein
VDHANLGIGQRQAPERGAPAEERLGIRGFQPVRLARGLDDDAQGRAHGPEHEWQAGHAEAADQPHTVSAIGVRPRLNGGEPALDEVDVRDVRAGLLQHLPPSQRHEFQQGLKFGPISRGESSQYQITRASQD